MPRANVADTTTAVADIGRLLQALTGSSSRVDPAAVSQFVRSQLEPRPRRRPPSGTAKFDYPATTPEARVLRQIGRSADFLYLSLPAEVLQRPVSELNLRLTRTSTGLYGNRIMTLEDLLERSETELRQIPYFWGRSVDEIKAALAERGWRLSPHDQDIEPFPGDDWVDIALRRDYQPRRLLRKRLYRLRLDWLLRCHNHYYYSVVRAWYDLGIRTVAEIICYTEAELQALPWSTVLSWSYNHAGRRSNPDAGLQATRHMLCHWGLALHLPAPAPAKPACPHCAA